MRHQRADWKLGRETNHRRSLLRNLVTSLLREERIMTTVQKAKFMRPHAERLITLGKRGGLHARRQAVSFLKDPETVKKLFDSLAARFAARPGGYTRATRLGWRQGDGAEMVMVELVGSVLKKRQADKKKKKEAEAKAAEPEQRQPDEGGGKK
jgi:large subunit ribosomal protein L17